MECKILYILVRRLLGRSKMEQVINFKFTIQLFDWFWFNLQYGVKGCIFQSQPSRPRRTLIHWYSKEEVDTNSYSHSPIINVCTCFMDPLSLWIRFHVSTDKYACWYSIKNLFILAIYLKLHYSRHGETNHNLCMVGS